MSRKSDTEGRATEILGPVIEDMGYELVYVRFLAERGRPILRFFIDKPGGVGIDDCERVSREIDTIIEVEEVVSGSYVLEVSSPGLDRPLFGPADYVRFEGKLAKVKTSEPIGGNKVFRGRITSPTDEGFTLVPDDAGENVFIDYSRVVKANLEVEF